MDKDEIKGTIRDVKGRVERQAGEWTGDKDVQAEGAKDQVAGKAQKAFGKAKEAVRDAGRHLRRGDRDPKHDGEDRDRPGDRDKDVA